MNMTKLETIEELEVLIEKTSLMSFLNIVRHARLVMVLIQNFKLIVVKKEQYHRYYLYVQDARDVSNRVAEQYSMKHESPQVLYIKDGMVVWNTSHWNIKKMF